jgi:hypothetical protein
MKNFDRERRPDMDVNGPVDLAHSAFPDLLLKSVFVVEELIDHHEGLAVMRTKGHIVFELPVTGRTPFHGGSLAQEIC